MDKHRGMNRIAGFITAVVFSVAAILFAIPAVAQVPETPATGRTVRVQDDAKPDLKLTDVEAVLVSFEADSEIEGSVKGLLRTKNR